MPEEIGKILFKERMKQPINFNNIRLKSIVPCDIDLLCEVNRKFCIEYQNKAWIFAEIKYRDTEFKKGQRLMHERLVDDLAKTGKPAISIIAEHYVEDPTQEVDAAECVVRQYYWHGQWHDCNETKLKDVLFSFVAKINDKFFGG